MPSVVSNAQDAGPPPICIRLTRLNRNSVASLLSVLEDEVGNGIDLRLFTDVEEVPAGALVVYSFMTPQADAVREEVGRLRDAMGESMLTIAGGPHPSGDPQGTLAMGFRWVAVGEAGTPFAELVRSVLAGSKPKPGVLPPWTLPNLDRYDPWPGSGRLFAHVEITRGCPIGCAFCQTPTLFGRKPRHRSLAALERLLRDSVRTGHRFTRFVAPNAFAYGSRDGRTPNPNEVEALLTMARRCGLKKVFFGTFPSEVRPESATPELLRLVHDLCDNRNLSVGLQSGSDDVLRRLHRGHTVEQGVKAVANMAEAGFVARVDFIFGLPGETDAQRRATREVVEHVTSVYGARVHAHVFTPLPGTPLAGATPSTIDTETRELVEALRGRGLASGHRTDFCRLPPHLVRMHESGRSPEGCPIRSNSDRASAARVDENP